MTTSEDDDWIDEQSAIRVSPSLGHYATGFSAVIKDGKLQEPVSSLGPIGFATRPLSAAALKRLNRKTRRKSWLPTIRKQRHR